LLSSFAGVAGARWEHITTWTRYIFCLAFPGCSTVLTFFFQMHLVWKQMPCARYCSSFI